MKKVPDREKSRGEGTVSRGNKDEARRYTYHWLNLLKIESNQMLFVTGAEYNRPYSEMLNTTGVVDLTVKCLLTSP